MTVIETISPASAMREVLAAYPGAQRALFTRYHIGGWNAQLACWAKWPEQVR